MYFIKNIYLNFFCLINFFFCLKSEMASSKGPGLYEFLIEAELQQYYAGFKNDLKVQNVPQLKYVTEDDLVSIGMSKPEMRRLKKFFQRHFPQNYLSKFKKVCVFFIHFLFFWGRKKINFLCLTLLRIIFECDAKKGKMEKVSMIC